MTPPSNRPPVVVATNRHQSPLVHSNPPPSQNNDIIDNSSSVVKDETPLNADDGTRQSIASKPDQETKIDSQERGSESNVDADSNDNRQVAIERTTHLEEESASKVMMSSESDLTAQKSTFEGNTNINNNNNNDGDDPKNSKEEGESSSSSSSDSSSEGEDEQDREGGEEGDREDDDEDGSSSSGSSGIDDDLFDSLEENVEDTETESSRGRGGSGEGAEVLGVVNSGGEVPPLIAGAEEKPMEVREEAVSRDVGEASRNEEGSDSVRKDEIASSGGLKNEGGRCMYT